MVYTTYIYQIGNVEVIDDRIEAVDFKYALDRTEKKYGKEKEKKKNIIKHIFDKWINGGVKK